MSADQRHHNRCLVIGIKIGPVHGNNNFRAPPDRIGDPSLRELVNVNPCVFDNSRSTRLIACFGNRPRANASPCPIEFTAREALLMTPSVAFANE